MKLHRCALFAFTLLSSTIISTFAQEGDRIVHVSCVDRISPMPSRGACEKTIDSFNEPEVTELAQEEAMIQHILKHQKVLNDRPKADQSTDLFQEPVLMFVLDRASERFAHWGSLSLGSLVFGETQAYCKIFKLNLSLTLNQSKKKNRDQQALRLNQCVGFKLSQVSGSAAELSKEIDRQGRLFESQLNEGLWFCQHYLDPKERDQESPGSLLSQASSRYLLEQKAHLCELAQKGDQSHYLFDSFADYLNCCQNVGIRLKQPQPICLGYHSLAFAIEKGCLDWTAEAIQSYEKTCIEEGSELRIPLFCFLKGRQLFYELFHFSSTTKRGKLKQSAIDAYKKAYDYLKDALKDAQGQGTCIEGGRIPLDQLLELHYIMACYDQYGLMGGEKDPYTALRVLESIVFGDLDDKVLFSSIDQIIEILLEGRHLRKNRTQIEDDQSASMSALLNKKVAKATLYLSLIKHKSKELGKALPYNLTQAERFIQSHYNAIKVAMDKALEPNPSSGYLWSYSEPISIESRVKQLLRNYESVQ